MVWGGGGNCKLNRLSYRNFKRFSDVFPFIHVTANIPLHNGREVIEACIKTVCQPDLQTARYMSCLHYHWFSTKATVPHNSGNEGEKIVSCVKFIGSTTQKHYKKSCDITVAILHCTHLKISYRAWIIIYLKVKFWGSGNTSERMQTRMKHTPLWTCVTKYLTT